MSGKRSDISIMSHNLYGETRVVLEPRDGECDGDGLLLCKKGCVGITRKVICMYI